MNVNPQNEVPITASAYASQLDSRCVPVAISASGLVTPLVRTGFGAFEGALNMFSHPRNFSAIALEIYAARVVVYKSEAGSHFFSEAFKTHPDSNIPPRLTVPTVLAPDGSRYYIFGRRYGLTPLPPVPTALTRVTEDFVVLPTPSQPDTGTWEVSLVEHAALSPDPFAQANMVGAM